MSQRSIRRIITLCALSLVAATIALAQSPATAEAPAGGAWQAAQQTGPSKGKLYVVTLDQPQHRQTCHIQSFTLDKLVCSRAIGGPRTYLPRQVVALIVPGDDALRHKLVFGFNVGLGAAIWGTVVLAAICPVCAVGTGIVALFFFGAAGVTLIGDGQPDHLLYLAPGQQLSSKLGFVQS